MSKQLPLKAAFVFIRRVAFFVLCLFLPAGTLDFWEAWVFLAVFFSWELRIFIYLLRKDPDLLKRRLKGGARAEKRMSQKVIMSLVSLFSILMVLVPGFDHRFHWSHVPMWLVLTADGGALFGAWIVFKVLKENSFASAVVELADKQKVISTGPYAIVRHPMYVGFLLVNFFMPIALGSWWGWPLALGLLLVGRFRIVDEEKLLRQELPGYEDYCRKVPYRIFPRIW